MNVEIPEWLIEMSEQMNSDPNNCTSHPYWQVRCRRIVTAADGLGGDFAIVDDEGEIYSSIKDDDIGLIEYLQDNYKEWAEEYEAKHGNLDRFNPSDTHLLPDELEVYCIQEVEEVVSTHLTKSDAEWFINRKQHDYPELYLYTASAYWSPQLKRLQNWIKMITNN